RSTASRKVIDLLARRAGVGKTTPLTKPPPVRPPPISHTWRIQPEYAPTEPAAFPFPFASVPASAGKARPPLLASCTVKTRKGHGLYWKCLVLVAMAVASIAIGLWRDPEARAQARDELSFVVGAIESIIARSTGAPPSASRGVPAVAVQGA